MKADGKRKGSLNRVFVNNYLSRVLERIRKFKSRPSSDDLQEIISAASLHASKVDPAAKRGQHQADLTPDKVDHKLRSLMKRHKRIQKKMAEENMPRSKLKDKEKFCFDCGNLITLIEKELLSLSKTNKGEAKGKGVTEKKAEETKEHTADEMEVDQHEDSREETVGHEQEGAQAEVQDVEEENEEHEDGEQEDVHQKEIEQEDARQEESEQEDAQQEEGDQEDAQQKESEQEDAEQETGEQEDVEQDSEQEYAEQENDEQEDAETDSDEEDAEQEGSKKNSELRKSEGVESLKSEIALQVDGKEAMSPGAKPRPADNVPVVTTPGWRGRRLNTALVTTAFQNQLKFVKTFHRLPDETELADILRKAYHFATENDPEGKHGKHRECPPDDKVFMAKRRSILKAFKKMKNQQTAGRGLSNRKNLTKCELHTIECANIINEIDALSKSGGVKRRLHTKPLPVPKKCKQNVAVKPAIVELEDVPSTKTLNEAAAAQEEEVVKPTEPQSSQAKTDNEDRCIAILDQQKRMMQLMLEGQQRIEVQQQLFYTSFLQMVKALLPTDK